MIHYSPAWTHLVFFSKLLHSIFCVFLAKKSEIENEKSLFSGDADVNTKR